MAMSRDRFVILGALWLLWPTAAYGYIDPGSGLLLVQGLISAVVGGLFIGRRAIGDALSRVGRALGLRPPADSPVKPEDLPPPR